MVTQVSNMPPDGQPIGVDICVVARPQAAGWVDLLAALRDDHAVPPWDQLAPSLLIVRETATLGLYSTGAVRVVARSHGQLVPDWLDRVLIQASELTSGRSSPLLTPVSISATVRGGAPAMHLLAALTKRLEQARILPPGSRTTVDSV